MHRDSSVNLLSAITMTVTQKTLETHSLQKKHGLLMMRNYHSDYDIHILYSVKALILNWIVGSTPF